MLSNKELAGEVRGLVAKGKLKEAINILQEHSAVQAKIDQVVMYAARLRDLEEMELNNTIDFNTLSIQKNQLRQDILRIAKDLDEIKKNKPLSSIHSIPTSAPVKKKSNTSLIIGIGLLLAAVGIGYMVMKNLNSNSTDHAHTDPSSGIEEPADIPSGTEEGIDNNTDDTADNTNPATPTKPLDGVVEVSNLKELLSAIKSNTTIRLKPGKYDLELAGTAMVSDEFVKLVPESAGFSKSGLTITGVEKLTLIGEEGSDLTTRLITDDYTADVLRLVNCKDITFKNIFFGHDHLSVCVGGVFDLIDSERIKYDNCVLHGSGTIGIYTENTNGVEFADSDIQECSIGLVEAKNSANFYFHGSDFIESHGAVGFDFETTSNVRFDNCNIEDNEYSEELFHVKKPRLVLKDVEITNTTYNELFAGFPQYVEQTDVIIK